MFHVQTENGPPAKQIMAPYQSFEPRSLCMLSLRHLLTLLDHSIPSMEEEKPTMRYLCLFMCLGMRAAHLEVVYGLDTDSFLNTFFPMVSRCGLPKDVLSDNGRNFVRTNNELEELTGLEREMIQEKTVCYGIKWHFNPPLAHT